MFFLVLIGQIKVEDKIFKRAEPLFIPNECTNLFGSHKIKNYSYFLEFPGRCGVLNHS